MGLSSDHTSLGEQAALKFKELRMNLDEKEKVRIEQDSVVWAKVEWFG